MKRGENGSSSGVLWSAAAGLPLLTTLAEHNWQSGSRAPALHNGAAPQQRVFSGGEAATQPRIKGRGAQQAAVSSVIIVGSKGTKGPRHGHFRSKLLPNTRQTECGRAGFRNSPHGISGKTDFGQHDAATLFPADSAGKFAAK